MLNLAAGDAAAACAAAVVAGEVAPRPDGFALGGGWLDEDLSVSATWLTERDGHVLGMGVKNIPGGKRRCRRPLVTESMSVHRVIPSK